MNVLMLSKDPALFSEDRRHIGDARQRHVLYANRLRERVPGSQLRIATYTPSSTGNRHERVSDCLELFGTRSLHRALFIPGLLMLLPSLLAGGWRPDVITVQTPWEEGLLGWLLARLLGARFVPQLHFDLFCRDWLAEHPFNYWRLRVAKQVLRAADVVRVVSYAQRAQVVRVCGLSESRVLVVPVGVNFTAIYGERAAHKMALGLEGPVVLFVGRFYAPKNLGLWLEVAARVLREVPTAQFVLVGDGKLRPALVERARALGVSDAVHFLGARPHVELPPIYAAADVFLLTSHYEGFGRVVLEAQLSGVPVVSTDCGGPADLVHNGRTGTLVAKGDGAALAAAVIELLERPRTAETFGRNGRMQAAAQFSLPVLADRLIDVWINSLRSSV